MSLSPRSSTALVLLESGMSPGPETWCLLPGLGLAWGPLSCPEAALLDVWVCFFVVVVFNF